MSRSNQATEDEYLGECSAGRVLPNGSQGRRSPPRQSCRRHGKEAKKSSRLQWGKRTTRRRKTRGTPLSSTFCLVEVGSDDGARNPIRVRRSCKDVFETRPCCLASCR